jgi:hypothetical protein
MPAPKRDRGSRRQLAQPWARSLFLHLEPPPGDDRSQRLTCHLALPCDGAGKPKRKDRDGAGGGRRLAPLARHWPTQQPRPRRPGSCGSFPPSLPPGQGWPRCRTDAPGSRAMRTSTRARLVSSKLQVSTLENSIIISRNLLLVFSCMYRLRADTGMSRPRRPRCPGSPEGAAHGLHSHCPAEALTAGRGFPRARDPGPGPAGPNRQPENTRR